MDHEEAIAPGAAYGSRRVARSGNGHLGTVAGAGRPGGRKLAGAGATRGDGVDMELAGEQSDWVVVVSIFFAWS